MKTYVTEYIARGNPVERRARLLRASQEDVKRLEQALQAGWDVQDDLDRARRSVLAFGG